MLTNPGLISFAIVGAITGWVLGRIIKTGHLVVADIGAGTLGALAGRYIVSAVIDTAGAAWPLIAIAGGAVPMCLSRLRDQS